MLLSLTSKLLASLLVVTLTLGALTVVLGQTLLSSHYIESKLTTVNGYQRLSTALIDQMAKQDGNQADPTIKAKLQSVLTPDLIKQKVDSALEQVQAYYEGTGPVPAIQVSDLVDKARAAGIPIDTASKGDTKNGIDLNKPITLNLGTQVAGAGKLYNLARTGALVLSLVLAALLLVVSWERHRWAALPDVLLNVGVFLAIVAAIFAFGPGIVENSKLLNQTNGNQLSSIGKDLASSLTSGMSRQLFMAAAGIFIVGLVLRILAHRQRVASQNSVKPKLLLKTKR